ncbi:MAG: alpha/beta hydrolase [Erythrobacter sp.]
MNIFVKNICAAILIALPFLVSPTVLAKSFYVEGEGGVPLAVTTTGNPDGPEILFLHGLSMGASSFSKQLESELAEEFRIVAFDLRGHALSGKPSETSAYDNPEVWAKDVARVMEATDLQRPILVGWSYGSLVAADYLRTFGTAKTLGIVMVGALGGFTPFFPPDGGIDPTVLASITRMRELRGSPSFANQREATELFIPLLTEGGKDSEWQTKAHQLALMVPPYVRKPLQSHPMDNTDIVGLLAEVEVMIIHGSKDPSVSQGGLAALRAAAPHLKVHTLEGAGHSPFATRPEEFNKALASFVRHVSKKRRLSK